MAQTQPFCSGREGDWADAAVGLGEDELVLPASNTLGSLGSRYSLNSAHSRAVTKASKEWGHAVYTEGYCLHSNVLY